MMDILRRLGSFLRRHARFPQRGNLRSRCSSLVLLRQGYGGHHARFVANKARLQGTTESLRGKGRGFTLLEALVSLAIVALALTVILKAQFYNLKVCSEAKNMLLAKMLLQKKMAEVELTEELETGEGVFLENKDFSWVLDSDEVEEGLKEINLTISWKEGNLIKDFCITTYLLKK